MLNVPTPKEKALMKQRYQAAKAPNPKPIGYCVYQCGVIVYGPITWGLCQYFMDLHGIKGKPKAKYQSWKINQ